MLDWFNTREVNEFAQALVDGLLTRYPPGGRDTDLKKATERLRKTHDALFTTVNNFAKSAKLNGYKIAQLGNKVRWALKDAGYPKDFVDTFTLELLTVVTVQSRKRPKLQSKQ